MYFASEPSEIPTVVAALKKIIWKAPQLHWLALVDGAFDYGSAGLGLPNERHALYDYGNMSDLLAASPFLIRLTIEDESLLQSELMALFRHRRERPMLSIIGSSSSAVSVNDNFRHFANAVTSDHQEFLLRFADTRVLQGLSSALRAECWSAMTSLLSNWIVLDRRGRLLQLPLHEAPIALVVPFQLIPAEFDALLANGEPDAIIDAIFDGNPEVLPERGRAELYELVFNTCVFAKKHQVYAFPDLVALAYIGILTNGTVLHSPTLSEMLQRREWKSGTLINELVDFID